MQTQVFSEVMFLATEEDLAHLLRLHLDTRRALRAAILRAARRLAHDAVIRGRGNRSPGHSGANGPRSRHPGGLLLHWLVAVPWMMAHEVAAFVVDYLRCRPWFFLPLAGPAILGLLLALYITAWLRVVPESDVIAMLDKHVVKARADRDWARARLGLQAILERKPDSQPHQFAFAQLLREGGDIRSAAAMLARLAPLDRVGYPPAHLLLAEETIARYENASPQDDRQLLLKQAIHHLEAGASTRNPRWEYQLGVLYIDRGDMTLAELHLEQAAARVQRGGLVVVAVGPSTR